MTTQFSKALDLYLTTEPEPYYMDDLFPAEVCSTSRMQNDCDCTGPQCVTELVEDCIACPVCKAVMTLECYEEYHWDLHIDADPLY